MSAEQELPAAAWYPDPGEPTQIRYWNGREWTEHVAPIAGLAQPVEGYTDPAKPFGRSLGLSEPAVDLTDSARSSGRRSLGLSEPAADVSDSTKSSGRRSLGLAEARQAPSEPSESSGRRSLGLAERAAEPAEPSSRQSIGLVDLRSSSRAKEAKSKSSTSPPPALGDGWHVAEEIVAGADQLHIEHLIVGAPGVFVLMTKDHGDSEVWAAERSLLIDGHKTEYLRDARHASREVSRILSARCGFNVDVQAVIVVDAKKLTVKSQPLDACVVALNLIGKWFSRQDHILGADAVGVISEVVSQAATWTSPDDGTVGRSDRADLRSFAST